jgi:hypothetical protein
VPGDHIFGGVQFGPTLQAPSMVPASKTTDAVRTLRKGISPGLDTGRRRRTEPIGSVNGHKVDFRGAASIAAEDVLFFEKKNQTTFVCLAPRTLMEATSGGEGAGAKVFWFFFAKNNTAFWSPDCPGPPAWRAAA